MNVPVVCLAQAEVRITCSFSVMPSQTALYSAAAEITECSREHSVGRVAPCLRHSRGVSGSLSFL